MHQPARSEGRLLTAEVDPVRGRATATVLCGCDRTHNLTGAEPLTCECGRTFALKFAPSGVLTVDVTTPN